MRPHSLSRWPVVRKPGGLDTRVLRAAAQARPPRTTSMTALMTARLARILGLRYAADLRSLAMLWLAAVLVYAPFCLNLSAPWAALWIVGSTLGCFNASVINHNHCHVPMFRSTRRNRWINIFFGCVRGHTSSTVIVPHNLNHHRYIGGARDWISPRLAGSGAGAWRLLRFVLRATLTMARERRRPGAPHLSAAQRRDQRIETGVLLVCIAVLFYLDGRKALLFAVLPWLGGLLLLVGINLLQHDGCEPHSVYGHSRNFTGRWANWFFFNNGYHCMHHRRPSLHWRRLPHAHAREVAPYLPSALDCASLFGFLLHGYFLNAGRPPRAARPLTKQRP